MRSEKYEDIVIFIQLFNEVLQKVMKDPTYRFNPRTFMCDEAGTNYKAIRTVYGDDFCKARVRGCQFHFKNSVHKRKHEVPSELKDVFISTCNQLCNVTSVGKYKILKSRLDEMVKTTPSLGRWITWWDDRKSHIFGPFRGGGLPGVNLSEQGNAGWVTSHTMCLVHAARYDSSTMILQECQVYQFDRNLTKSSGRGPSQAVRSSKDCGQQINVAVDFHNIADDDEMLLEQAREANNPSGYLPRAKSSFKPTILPAKEPLPEGEQQTKKFHTKKVPKKKRGLMPSSNPDVMSDKLKVAEKVINGEDINGSNGESETVNVPENNNNNNNNSKNNGNVIRRLSTNQYNPPMLVFTDGLGIRRCQACKPPVQIT